MMQPIAKIAQNVVDRVYYGCSKDISKMLIHTSAIGWAASSAAQIVGIAFNDKISYEKKKFLVPQETMDAVGNIGLYYFVTHVFDLIAKSMCDQRKIKFEYIENVLQERAKQLKCDVADLFKDKFGDVVSLEKVLKFDEKALKYFAKAKCGLSILTLLVGGVISSNIITPLVRNYYGAKVQAKAIEKKQ